MMGSTAFDHGMCLVAVQEGGLQELTPDISRLVNLEVLRLKTNPSLGCITESISCLQKLECLHINASSGFVSLKCPRLKVLVLDDMKANMSPAQFAAICKLSSLEQLDISGSEVEDKVPSPPTPS
jgi:hypothetical protein